MYFVLPPPLCAQRGYGGRWLTPLRHYDSRPLRAANRAVSSKSGRLIRRWRRLSRFPPCFRWGSKGKVSMRQRYLPLALYGNTPRGSKKKTLSSQYLWDESARLRGATQIRGRLPPLAFWYGKGTVDVSVPAPPLSFLRCRRDSLSVKSLSVSLSSGVLLRRHRGLIIIAVFRRFVKR